MRIVQQQRTAAEPAQTCQIFYKSQQCLPLPVSAHSDRYTIACKCTHTCTYAPMHMHILTCMPHAPAHTPTHTHMHTYTHAYVHDHMQATCTCTHTEDTHMQVHTYTTTHSHAAHTHTHGGVPFVSHAVNKHDVFDCEAYMNLMQSLEKIGKRPN